VAEPASSSGAPGPGTERVLIDLYGLRLSISGDWPGVIRSLSLDFAWFASDSEAPADVEVLIERRPPDFDAFDGLTSTFVTPRNVVYQAGDRTVIDYFGRALSVVEAGGDRLLIRGEEEDVVYQAAYLFVLSRAGQHFDRRGLPRMHGLGLAGQAGGVVALLPSGGGKSALALQAMRSPAAKLLSEDSPLVDRRGRVHPFPLRIGLHPEEAERHPLGDGALREIERLEFGPKVALEVSAFADRIESDPVPLRHLVIGRRSLGTGARLEPAPRRAALGPLIREAIVGVGLYQGMEFVLQRGMRDVMRNWRPALIRSICCAAALRRATVWRLELGRDRKRNWEALESLL
jgi:hypothetical protein